MSERIVHSFEAGRRGKPDELDSGLAHLLGAAILEFDRNARFDLRVHGGYEGGKLCVNISGEVSENVIDSARKLVAPVVVGYYNDVHQTHLTPDDFVFHERLKPQAQALALNGHAGDSGNPIAVAYRNGPDYHHGPNCLPWERYVAVSVRDILDNFSPNKRFSPLKYYSGEHPTLSQGLRSDGKVSVDALYEGAQFRGIQNITIAVEHEKSLSVDELRTTLEKAVRKYLSTFVAEARVGNPKITTNGLGAWHQGGWKVDEGNREAKPYRDGFATYGCCEDSFSGEDPSKPSGTGTFLARYIAVQIVAHDLADFARVALQYTIGREEVGLNITTQETARVEQSKLEKWVRDTIPLRIKDAVELFGLRDPALYRRVVAASDFFHNPEFPWNRVNRELVYKK